MPGLGGLPAGVFTPPLVSQLAPLRAVRPARKKDGEDDRVHKHDDIKVAEGGPWRDSKIEVPSHGGQASYPTAVDSGRAELLMHVGKIDKLLIGRDGELRLKDHHFDICFRFVFPAAYIIVLIVFFSILPPRPAISDEVLCETGS